MIAAGGSRRRGYTSCLGAPHSSLLPARPGPAPPRSLGGRASGRPLSRTPPAALLCARALSRIKETRPLHRPEKFGPGRCPAPRKGAAPPLTSRQLGARDIFGVCPGPFGIPLVLLPFSPVSARLNTRFALLLQLRPQLPPGVISVAIRIFPKSIVVVTISC